jgi:site-specific DNA-cytosine methylase
MIVLSLFDGMSCGQIALNQLGIKIEKYFAAEIKPHAIKCTQHNFPDTIQIGDVQKVSYKDCAGYKAKITRRLHFGLSYTYLDLIGNV